MDTIIEILPYESVPEWPFTSARVISRTASHITLTTSTPLEESHHFIAKVREHGKPILSLWKVQSCQEDPPAAGDRRAFAQRTFTVEADYRGAIGGVGQRALAPG